MNTNTWKIWESIINAVYVGIFFVVTRSFVYFFLYPLFLIDLSSLYLVEIIFLVIIAFQSYRKIKIVKFGIFFGLMVGFVSEIAVVLFYGGIPFEYVGLLNDPEWAGLVFANLAIRFVGFPLAGFFGSYIRVRKKMSLSY